MSVASVTPPPAEVLEQPVEVEHRATPLELFFDLVFVFALTQVTASIAADPTWGGVGEGMLLLAALWWAWGGYAWLTNTLATDEGLVRLTLFAAMAAMLVASLAAPGAFGDDSVVFGAAYLVVRVLHVATFHLATRGDAGVHGAVARLVPVMLGAPLVLFAACLLDGPAQVAVWGLALVIDYGGPLTGWSEGWNVHPGHFAERHGLILIIALGESIVALGVGAEGLEVDALMVVAAALGIAIASALWWSYFDVVAIVAERKLHEATGAARSRLARDSYSYIHVLLIAGIVLFAVGVKKTLADLDHELKPVPAAAMFGGIALYLIGHLAFRLRNVGSINRPRLVVAIALLACIPLGDEIPALASLAVVAGLLVALIAYEATRYAEARRRVRHGA